MSSKDQSRKDEVKNGEAKVREVVKRYYEVVADLNSEVDTLADLLAKKVTIIERPNPISLKGTTRGKAETLDGLASGKELLSEQSFEVHEILVSGHRAAVRATWRGTIGIDAGPLTTGTKLLAHVAAFLTVEDGKIVEHETFDCYEPWEPAAGAH